MPDELSAPFWAGGGRRRARRWPAARAARAFAHPPDVVCPHCDHTDPAFAFEPVSGRGRRPLVDGRAPVVPARASTTTSRSCSSTSRSTSSDDLRLIGRLLDGPDAPLRRRRPRRRSRSRSSPTASPSPPSPSTVAVTGRFAARNQVAIVGLRPEPDRQAASTARSARSPSTSPGRRSPTPGCDVDAGRRVRRQRPAPDRRRPRRRRRRQHRDAQLARRSTSASTPATPPASRASASSRARWRWPSTRVASGAADHVLVHRALHNPPGRYHGNSRDARRAGPTQWTAPQGFFGPLADDRPGRQRVPRSATAPPARRSARSWSRPARTAPGIPWSYWHDRPLDRRRVPGRADDRRPDLPVRLRHARRRRGRVRAHHRRAGPRPPEPAGVRRRLRERHARPRHRLPLHWPLDDIIDVGAETARRLWERAGVGPGEVDLPQVYDGFSPFVWFWLEVLGLLPGRRGPPVRARTAASTATSPGALPGAVGRRRPRQRPHARRPADARVLPAALGPGRRPPARRRHRGRRLPLLAALRRRRRLQRRDRASDRS